MTMIENMTNFQKKCIKEVIYTLAEYGLGEVHPQLRGNKEKYYLISLDLGKSKIELYVYEDEAGIMLEDNRWIIFEKPDYKSDDKLINDFIVKLKGLLQEFRGNTA